MVVDGLTVLWRGFLFNQCKDSLALLNTPFVTEREDDCDKALQLWGRLQEADYTPSQKFVRNLVSMAKANNKAIPTDLVALLDKQKASN